MAINFIAGMTATIRSKPGEATMSSGVMMIAFTVKTETISCVGVVVMISFTAVRVMIPFTAAMATTFCGETQAMMS